MKNPKSWIANTTINLWCVFPFKKYLVPCSIHRKVCGSNISTVEINHWAQRKFSKYLFLLNLGEPFRRNNCCRILARNVYDYFGTYYAGKHENWSKIIVVVSRGYHFERAAIAQRWAFVHQKNNDFNGWSKYIKMHEFKTKQNSFFTFKGC